MSDFDYGGGHVWHRGYHVRQRMLGRHWQAFIYASLGAIYLSHQAYKYCDGVQPKVGRECEWWCNCLMAFDYWAKCTASKKHDIYVPSRRSRAVPRDPTTLC